MPGLADMQDILLADIEPVNRKPKLWMKAIGETQIFAKPVACALRVVREDQDVL